MRLWQARQLVAKRAVRSGYDPLTRDLALIELGKVVGFYISAPSTLDPAHWFVRRAGSSPTD
jgi:hypothetical protein